MIEVPFGKSCQDYGLSSITTLGECNVENDNFAVLADYDIQRIWDSKWDSKLSIWDSNATEISDPNYPKGCFIQERDAWFGTAGHFTLMMLKFNDDVSGSAEANSIPLCKIPNG